MKSKALATIALCKVEDPCRYGVAEMVEGNRIKQFIEKPPKDKAPSNLINAGVYVLSPKSSITFQQEEQFRWSGKFSQNWLEEGKLCGHFVNGLWMDIGKPEEYLETNKIILNHYAKTMKQIKAKNFEIKKPVAFETGVSVGRKISNWTIRHFRKKRNCWQKRANQQLSDFSRRSDRRLCLQLMEQ